MAETPFLRPSVPPISSLLALSQAALVQFSTVRSRAEIESVLSLGVSPDRIVYANPCKAGLHIEYARTVNVNLATFDSVHELHKMSQHHPQCSLLLRIKPPVSTGVRRSLGAKYGALPDEVGPLLEAAQSMDLSVIGVSFHIGISATVFETYDAAIEAAREAFDLAEEMGLPRMSVLNIGGGFTAGPLLEKAAKVIKCSIDSRFEDWAGLRVIAEPGRCFTETAATLATCVIGKRVRGAKREYWVNDGIYGSMCCIKMDAVNVSIVPLEQRPEGTETYASTVFGPTCDSMDVIASEVELPELEVGEWMVSPAMGAYTKAMGSSFNGFSTPDLRVYLANSVTTE
ncbi:ornithine decarboxylase-like [Asparagus officinalis]|uniref:ornithine decarboxylase-like n=1 Tax=Asparagus officinalis TaxID=4686 RepID=UPI00098E1ED2|nr:ornithine decarboxylase-like [Asparagus officinalis]